VPDDADYAWLQELLDRPEWSADDLATAQFLLANQQHALDAADARDQRTVRRLGEVVDALQRAIERHRPQSAG
jgi:hypothetical protein